MRPLILTLAVLLTGAATAQTFLRTVGLPNRNERGLVLHRTPSGAIFLGGSVGDSALVQRIDADGNVLWSRAFKPQGQYPKMVYHMADAPDGSIIGCGNGLSPIAAVYEGFHFKVDIDGNFQWIRTWVDGLAYNREVAAYSATEMIMYSCYYPNGGSFADYFQTHIDLATGNVNWTSPRYDLFPTVPYIDDVVGVTQIGSSRYATGRIFTNGSPVSTCRVNLTKLDAQGQHLWTRYLIYPNNISRRMYGCDIIATNDSLTIIYSGDVTGASGNLSVGMIRTDTLGNVAWARDYNIAGSANEHVSQVIPTSFGFVMMGRTVAAPNQRSFLMGISFGGDLLWTKTYGGPADVHVAPHTYLKSLLDMGDGYLVAGVSRVGADDNVLLIRTDVDGLLTCAPVSDPVVATTVLPTATFSTAPVTYPIALTLYGASAIPGNTTAGTTCSLQFDLGPDTAVCSPTVLHASLAGATFTWQDGSTADTLLVTAPGIYWATAYVGCCTITDTVEVFFAGSAAIDLGPDTVVCAGSSLQLAVDPIWNSVIWNDATTADTLDVTAPGTYWVDVDLNGCTASDTIVVADAILPVLDLGPDTAVCDGSQLMFYVDAQWSNVLWNIGSVSDTLVLFTPGTYWVDVALGGCTASDTVLVFQAEAALLDLGPDTLICPGGSVELLLDTVWNAVLWSDGSFGDTLNVNAPGTYWVEATFGICPSADTIDIQLAALPPLEIGPDTTLCTGSSFSIGVDAIWDAVLWSDGSTTDSILVAVPGMIAVDVGLAGCATNDSLLITWVDPPLVDLGPDTSACVGEVIVLNTGLVGLPHTWQDGSGVVSFAPLNSGTYWVEVGAVGCTGTDTVLVQFNAYPQVGLGPDTSFCPGSTVMLGPVVSNSTVQWSDGSAAPTLTVAQQGSYWVSVDELGCISTDTVQVIMGVQPQVVLGPDTSNCTGQAIAITPLLASGGSLQWSTGAGTPTINAAVTGSYWLAIANGCGSAADTIAVSIAGPVDAQMGGDTTFCGNVALLLHSTYPAANSTWSTGVQAISIPIMIPGTYWLTITVDGCVASDTIIVDQAPLPQIVLMADTVLCTPTAITLSPMAVVADLITWPDGSTGLSYIAALPGTYTAVASNGCGQVVDSVVISVAPEPGNMGPFTVCFDHRAEVALPAGATAVLWSTGVTEPTVLLSEGEHTYQYTDAYGCSRAGSVEVITDPASDGLVYVPNVFTPDNDEINDRFKVVGADREEYELTIFNRWGELIFNSVDPDEHWDGTYGGALAPDGTYVYVLRYRDRCNGTRMAERMGHVSVLR